MFWVVANPALPGSELRQSCVTANILIALGKPVVAGKGRQTKDRQSHLRLLGGIWHVQLKDRDGKRKTLSLQTSNRFEAELRVGQGLTELKRRIRQQALASAEKVPCDAKGIIWELPEGMEGTVENYERYARAVEATAGELLSEEELEDPSFATWREITRAARERRVRLHAKDYSASWYKALQQTIDLAKELNLTPEDLSSPKNCLAMVRAMEAKGVSRTTLTQRIGVMASALTGAKKSGEFPELRNAFGDIDFRSTAGKKKYEEPTPEQLEQLLKALPDLPRHHRLAFEVLLVTGGRVGAVTGLLPGDLDDGGCWLVGKGKPRYWVPLPAQLFEDLKQGFKFSSSTRVRDVLKTIIPRQPHGLRHLFTSMGRRGGIPLDAQARLMDHSLPGSMTQEVYGEWPHDRLRDEASKVWSQLGYGS